VETARKLAASGDASARWIGKDALRDLTRAQVINKLSRSKRSKGLPF